MHSGRRNVPAIVSAILLPCCICVGMLGSSAAPADAMTARLSWDSTAVVQDIPELADNQAPIFLKLSGVPAGATLLAVDLRWSPDDLFGPCFYFAGTSGGGGCAVPAMRSIPETFQGDSTFWFSLTAPASGDICIRYDIGAGSCSGRVADFCLLGVWVATADTMFAAEVLGGATIGGGGAGCPVAALQVIPYAIPRAVAAELQLIGAGLTEDVTIQLVSPETTLTATNLQLLSAGRLRFGADLLGFSGRMDLRVLDSGDTTMIPNALFVVDATTRAYAEDRAIVWFKHGEFELPLGATSARVTELEALSPGVSTLLQSIGAVSLTAASSALLEEPAAAASLADPRQLDVWVVQLADTNVLAACAVLRADTARVIEAFPDFCYTTLDVVPTDVHFPMQWTFRNTSQITPASPEHSDADGPGGWGVSTGGVPVDVAILDTGGAPSHPDLSGRITNGPNFAQNQGSVTPYDVTRHGTECRLQGSSRRRATAVVAWSASIGRHGSSV